MDDLITAVRRRLRLTWTVATLQWAAPAVALVALILVVAGRLRPWAWPELAALVVAIIVVLAVVVGAAAVRIPDLVAARAADRGLDTRDALAAALEVGDEPGPFTARVHARAVEAAAGASAREAVPMPRPLRRMAASSVLAAGALGLAWLPNPQDDVRRERAAEQAALADEADDLRDAADALDEMPGAGEAEAALAEELRALAEDLDDAGSLEEGLGALAQARADLEAQVPADLLALKAATTGLDRSLEATPLPGTTGGSAAEQLEQLADALAGLSPEDHAALAERLGELAATQAVGNPGAAEALDAAAAALASGDLAGAEAALGEAAAAQVSASASAQAGEAAAAAASAVASSAADAQAADAQGAGEQAGAADGGTPGTGQGSGAGDGQGSGSGSGQGSGGGQGGGGPGSGNIGAGGSRTGTGDGQGGAGRPSGGTSDGGPGPSGDERGASDPLIYDPAYSDGDQIDVGGSGSGRPGETVGRTSGATGTGQVRVPVSQLRDDYIRRATDALDRGDLPPSSQEVIRAYFDAIAGFGD